MGRSEQAVERFRSGFNCSQAVLAAFAEDYGLDLEAAAKIACGFGGGMGRTGHTCGAVTGAIMVLGLAESGPDPLALVSKVRVYGLVQDLMRQFEALHQTTSCRELLGCEIGTPEGYQEAQRLDLFQTRCPDYVADAVQILEEML